MAQFYVAKSSRQKRQKQSITSQHVTLDIEQYNHDGQGIGYLSEPKGSKICFVQGALPGEKVTAKLVENKAKVAKAICTQVINPSAKRIEPSCKHFSRCGGCQLQYVSVDDQLMLKQHAVSGLFKRFSKLEQLPWQASLASSQWHYRRAARVGVWYHKQQQSYVVGFRAHNDKIIIPIEQCLVLNQTFDSLFSDFTALLPNLTGGRLITHLELLHTTDVDMVVIRHTGALSKADRQAILKLGEKRHWVMVSEYEKGQFSAISNAGETPDKLPSLAYDVTAPNGTTITLNFAIGDFIQVNSQINQQMIAQAADWLALEQSDRLLDLFCGIGNFSLPLATICDTVVAVEGVDEMVKRGCDNANRNNLTNVTFHQADLSQDFTQPGRQKALPGWLNDCYDKILLDPARAGAQAIMASIAKLQRHSKAKKVLYVSCDPLTLARDSAILLEQGYQLKKIALMDMFAHTRHVEVMALFEQ